MDIPDKYQNYINDVIKGILVLMPEDVNHLQHEYLVNNMKKSATLLAESMQDDEEFIKLDFETQCFYIQIMAEWSFHKEIDLFRSGIPAKYWKTVMQKIWYVMWEVMWACAKNDAENEVVLTLVERFVNRSYLEAIEELKSSDIINEEIEEIAKGQSNIAIMAHQLQLLQNINHKIKHCIRTVILFIIIAGIVSFSIIKFKTVGLISILTLLAVYAFLPSDKK